MQTHDFAFNCEARSRHVGSASALFQNENYSEKSYSGDTPGWTRTEFSLVYSKPHDEDPRTASLSGR